jgi:hypothetical protein
MNAQLFVSEPEIDNPDEYATSLMICQETIKNYKCGYCNKMGHKIQQCQDPNIIIMESECKKQYIFNYLVIKCFRVPIHINHSACFKIFAQFMSKKSHGEIKAILYYILKSTQLTININDKNECINHIIVTYYHTYIYSDIIHMFSQMDTSSFISILFEYNQKYPNFTLLLRKYNFIYRHLSNKFNVKVTNNINNLPEINECHICYELIPKNNMVVMKCDHSICFICLLNYFKSISSANEPLCSYCRTPITEIDIENNKLYQYISDNHILYPYIAQESQLELIPIEIPLELSQPELHQLQRIYQPNIYINHFRVTINILLFIYKYNRIIYIGLVMYMFYYILYKPLISYPIS